MLTVRRELSFMRKLTFRDLLATLIVAAVVVPFIGYSVRGSMPFVQDPRGMAGVGIVGAIATLAVFGRKAVGSGAFEWIMPPQLTSLLRLPPAGRRDSRFRWGRRKVPTVP